MNEALKFDAVSVGYGDTVILKEMDLSVPEGDFVAVIGPNGAGKTTLLRAVTGFVSPRSGSIRIFGQDLAGLPASDRAKLVGVVSQEIETPMAYTVEDMVLIGRTSALSRWHAPSRADFKIVERAMVYADVVDMRNRLYSELSAGEKKRAVIAMVLAQEPRMILLDEATSHLDINHRLEIMEIVKRLNVEHNVTVLMVSHDLNLSAEFCNRLMLLDHGHMVSEGSPRDVLTESTLRRVYHCDVHVQQNLTTGVVHVTPASRLVSADHSGKGIRIHVVAGGGCGEELLRRLSLCQYVVTCGVLNRQDSDADVASALGIEAALEEPFSPVGAQALDRAKSMIEQAQAVIVCGVPFGPGNVGNLDLPEQALNQDKPVWIMDGTDNRDYTVGKQASEKVKTLLAQGAKSWAGIADLLDALPTTETATS